MAHTGSLPTNLHIFFFMQLKTAAFELVMPTTCTKDKILKGSLLCHLTSQYLFNYILSISYIKRFSIPLTDIIG